MKRFLAMGTLVGILLALGPPAMAAKYTFDLSKGPVSFSYTTIGAYNPIEITIIGKNGVAQTWLASDYYQSQTLLEAMNELLMKQHGAVPWVRWKGPRGTSQSGSRQAGWARIQAKVRSMPRCR